MSSPENSLKADQPHAENPKHQAPNYKQYLMTKILMTETSLEFGI